MFLIKLCVTEFKDWLTCLLVPEISGWSLGQKWLHYDFWYEQSCRNLHFRPLWEIIKYQQEEWKTPTNSIFNQTWREKYFSESKIYMKGLLKAAGARHRCGGSVWQWQNSQSLQEPISHRERFTPGGRGRGWQEQSWNQKPSEAQFGSEEADLLSFRSAGCNLSLWL